MVITVVLGVGIILTRWRLHSPRVAGHDKTSTVAEKLPAATTNTVSKAAAGSTVVSASELSRRQALFPAFRKHPFAVAEKKGAYGWTSEDGKAPDVIRQLAHNELEFERMAGENDRIYRRQLVYDNDTVAAQIERAKLSGKAMSEIELPGLDGQEVAFKISKTDLSPSGEQGTFSGQVAGRLDSMVTFAFKGGREAFTILSPADNLYLVGEPREPGELVVKSINPETYVVGTDGTQPAK